MMSHDDMRANMQASEDDVAAIATSARNSGPGAISRGARALPLAGFLLLISP